jgi:uncharacterized protein (TIGR02646 family)
MVKIKRSPLPAGQSITRDSDYTSGPVYELLKSDFNEKCYICEDKATRRGIEVEHLNAHRGDVALKYDWNNLFLSCHHCNRLKNANFNDIIDCIKTDPEDYINLDLSADIKTAVIITKTNDIPGIDETMRLLDRVYNGEVKPIMRDECIDLRSDVRETIRKFNDLLTCHANETDTGLKSVFADLIKKSIAKKSPFAAFKRGIVRYNTALFAEFGELLGMGDGE